MSIPSNLITTDDVTKIFNVSKMTIYLWRKNHDFPFITLPGGLRPPIRFVEADIKEWAQTHNKEMVT
jgi:predicted DNA-binding transcriptional regulator AlpA